jgi:hypothetical protein
MCYLDQRLPFPPPDISCTCHISITTTPRLLITTKVLPLTLSVLRLQLFVFPWNNSNAEAGIDQTVCYYAPLYP